jgi:hypothetical protein
MSIPRTRRPPARDADASEKRQALISNRHDPQVDERGDTLTRIEPFEKLGEPIVGDPWPSDIRVEVQYHFDREPARARRSLGIQVHVAKRTLLVLVLVTALVCGTFGRNSTFIRKMLTTVTKAFR